MPKPILHLFVMMISLSSLAQESSRTIPGSFGNLQEGAPAAAADYEDLIGLSRCIYLNRNQDGSWQDSVKMEWTFRYIMAGTAVQDIAIKDNGEHSSSIRQFNPDSARWYVTYFTAKNVNATSLVWTGEQKEGDNIVLYKPHDAPAGEGYSRLTFSSISKNSFQWDGTWVSKDGSVEYLFRKIHCTKVQ